MKKQILLILVLLFFNTINSAGVTYEYIPSLLDGVYQTPWIVYNSDDNQFLVSWISGASQINGVIYDTAGNVVVSQKNILSGAGTSPSICYDDYNQQFFLTFNTGQPLYTILDASADVIVPTTAVAPISGKNISCLPSCCYNSINNQYCVSWTAQDIISGVSTTFFAILDSDGSLAIGPIEIPNLAGIDTISFSSSFVVYNSVNNQYFFNWSGISSGGSDTHLCCAIYDANGIQVGTTQEITQRSGAQILSSPSYSVFNNFNNQYLITWISSDYSINFTILDHNGSVVVPSTLLNSSVIVILAPVCSYSLSNNQYFITWSCADSVTTSYAILNDDGSVDTPQTDFEILPGKTVDAITFNAYSSTDGTYFSSWSANDGVNAYYNLLSLGVMPPSNLLGQHLLNRFANYGEYVNQMQWSPSLSPNLSAYKIYQESVLLQTLPSSQTMCQLHNQPAASTVYSVTAVNNVGSESVPVSITL